MKFRVDVYRICKTLPCIEKDPIMPMEIKAGVAPAKPTRNFSVLSKYHLPIGPGLVISNCDIIRPVNEQAFLHRAVCCRDSGKFVQIDISPVNHVKKWRHIHL